MSSRVYVPLDLATVGQLLREQRLAPPTVVVIPAGAAGPSDAASAPGAQTVDEEEAEYAAMTHAAELSARRQAADDPAQRRRIVMAADLDLPAEALPGERSVDTEILLTAAACFLVDVDDSGDLAWYAVHELADLI